MIIRRKSLFKTIQNVFKWRTSKYFSSSEAVIQDKWRIVFFGTDHFALQSLHILHKAFLEGVVVKDLAVVVPAPKPHLCLVARYASKHSIPISVWPLPKETWTGELSDRWDLGVVASFGHLIPKRIINAFPMGMLNVHASLLPRWRGAAPIMHAILNGDSETGVTIMRIKPFHFDVGDIVLQESTPIGSRVTAVELTDQLARMGAALLFRCVSDLKHHLDRSISQPMEGVTLAPKLNTELSHVDWSSLNATQVYNRWRATKHLFKLHTFFHGEPVKLDGGEPPISEPISDRLSSTDDAKPGKILVDRRLNLLMIRCQKDWARFERLTIPRRPPMSAVDFANGYLSKRPPEQHVFLTPPHPAS